MKLNIYSIYDSAAKAYMQPFFVQTNGIAIRLFTDNVNSKDDNQVSKHPQHFTLFKIGEFDDQKGTIEPMTPEAVATGSELKEPEPETQLKTLIGKLLNKLDEE